MIASITAVMLCGHYVRADRPMDLNLVATVEDFRALQQQGEEAHWAVIGDSISFKADTYVWFLRDMLEMDVGNAGDGYRALTSLFRFIDDGTNNSRPGLSFEGGPRPWWVNGQGSGERDSFGRRSVDGLYSLIGYIGAVEITLYGPEATLHYVREVGAGTIRVTVNGNAVAEIDASKESGDPELGLYTFATGQGDPDSLSTVRFELVGATEDDPQWTQLNGVQMTTGMPGAKFSRLSRGGAGPGDFVNADPLIFADTLRAVNPDLLIVMLDRGPGGGPYPDKMSELLKRVEAAIPETEVLLASHHHFIDEREFDTNVLIDLANARDLGFLNLFDLHEGFEHLNELGFLSDSVHLSAAGGEWFARYFYHALHAWTVATTIDISRGTPIEGDLYETRGSDNDLLTLRSQRGTTIIEPEILIFESEFVSDYDDPTLLDLRIEWRITEPGGVARIRFRNWTNGGFDQIAQVNVGMTEETLTLDDIPASDYVHGITGVVEVQVETVIVASFSFLGFDTLIDHIQVRIE